MENGKRFIDADEFAKCLKRMTKTAYPNLFPGLLEAIDFAKDFIPADVVEVVHGRWIETLVPDGYVQKASRMRKKCSVCGWANACRYKYCPNCGAKMDK